MEEVIIMGETNVSRRSFVIGMAAAVPALALAGCGSEKKEATEPASGKTAGLKSTSGKSMKVICTSEAYSKLFDKFSAETGAQPVEYISMSSGEALSRLRAEGGTPAADLWFGGGIDSFMSAASDGLLEKVQFDRASEFATGFKSEGDLWFSKGSTVVGFLVNEAMLSQMGAKKPLAWADLVDPSYRDNILMSSPAVSGTNYAVVNAILQTLGDEKGWAYFASLNENIPYYTRRGSDPSTRVAAGEAAIGITYLDRTLDEILQNKDLSLVYPTDGIPYIPDGVAAFKGGEDVEDAKLFIEWLFSSDENLKSLTEIDKKSTVLMSLPTVKGIELDFDTSLLMDEDLELFGSQRKSVLAKWEEVTSGKTVLEK
ncbi:MAG: extracellular solute-binding protein [Berryella intestinalis]|uniref:extracellular solute-binding protein n=1 Tax=Berryella intestinalis TaxID=1531429 RepID=UPI002A575205|nr:extracellular solute-binding protein [Berryella intestinalis]MDD7369865.1 extracellular solute-binding protein [Berryella intestinalis]MDY3129561.1 extracellular solute-binding protein [Berryella intestinalis]